MSKVRIAYVQTWRDKKTGRSYIRFRKRGSKSGPLPGPIGSKQFWQAYQQALDGTLKVGESCAASPAA